MTENTENGLGEIREIRDKSGNTMTVFKYGEDVVPFNKRLHDFSDPNEHMLRLRDMEAKDDDILICAHAKAGTHWVWEIIMMLTRGTTEYAAGPKEETMLDFRSVDKLEALASPRIFNTHLRLSNLPKGMIERKCKMVFVFRNPKDTAVSLYSHISAMGSAFAYRGSFDDFLSLFMGDIFPHNAWPGYVMGWEADLAVNKDIPRHIIHFEDLKQKDIEALSWLSPEVFDSVENMLSSFHIYNVTTKEIITLNYLGKNPVQEVKMLASYLDVTCTDSFISEIVDKCSFTNLKEGKTDCPDTNKWKFMYRKGEVGDWKNWFTVAQNEAFDKYITKVTEKSNFKFKYTL